MLGLRGVRAAIGKYCSRAAMLKEVLSLSLSEEAPLLLLNNDMGKRTPWMNFLCDPTCPVPSVDALDLLDGLLVYNHERRWTVRETLGHAFFDNARERVLREVREGGRNGGRQRRRGVVVGGKVMGNVVVCINVLWEER